MNLAERTFRFIKRRRAISRKRRLNRRASRRRRPISWKLGSFIDRAMYPFMPITASKRMNIRRVNEFAALQFEKLSGRAHSGAKTDPYRKWLPSRLSPDSFLREDLEELRDRCSDLYRSNPVASSAVEGRVANEVGVGILCQPKVKETPGYIPKETARQFNSETAEIYNQWSQKRVDRSRILTLAQFQKQVVRTFAVAGECFIRYGNAPYRGPIPLCMEIIPAEQIETPPEKAGDPYCVMGIQKNSAGEVVGYWRRTTHPGDDFPPDKLDWEFIERFDKATGLPNISHVFEPMFPGQTRGIPWLANGNAMTRAKDVEDVFEAELINKQVETLMGVLIEGGDNSPDPITMAEGRSTTSETDGTKTTRIEELHPGLVQYMNQGEKAHIIDPSRPGTTFVPFIESALRSIASALNYPYELLAKNFFRVTYSSGRLAMLDGRLGFRMRTQTIKDMWLCELHEHVVHESFMSGALSMAMGMMSVFANQTWMFLRHVWRGRERGLLDPEKENKGHAIGLDYEIENKTEILSERAVELDEHEENLIEEGKRAIDRQVELLVYRQKLEQGAGLEPGSTMPADKKEYDPNNTKNDEPEASPEESELAV